MTESEIPPEEAAESPPEETPEEAPKEPSLDEQLAERTADLQRLQAEYVNYKKRVDRDRQLIREQGESAVLRSLLTVLDSLDKADEHGELTGGFKAVADSLQAAVKQHGLEPFGAKGEPFDPAMHEAVFHAGEADVAVTTIDQVMRIGYRVGDRVLRPATVGVVDPKSDEAPAEVPAEPEQESDIPRE